MRSKHAKCELIISLKGLITCSKAKFVLRWLKALKFINPL